MSSFNRSNLYFRPYVTYSGDERTYGVTLTSFIPNVYAKWKSEATRIHVDSTFNRFPPTYLTIEKDLNKGRQQIYVS